MKQDFDAQWNEHLAHPKKKAIILVGGHPGSGKTTWAYRMKQRDPEHIVVLDDPSMDQKVWQLYDDQKHHTIIIADPFIALKTPEENIHIVLAKLPVNPLNIVWFHLLFPDQAELVENRARVGAKPLMKLMKGRFKSSEQTHWLQFEV